MSIRPYVAHVYERCNVKCCGGVVDDTSKYRDINS